jgi:hypothetical protein
VPPPTATSVPTIFIQSFDATVEDLEKGKRLTFTWQTTGATGATIISGTSHRFPLRWDVAASGTHTVELDHTNYPNPTMILIAFNDQGEEVSQALTIAWPCTYTYYFTPAPLSCPRYEATFTEAAEQTFEYGRMIWVKTLRGEDFVLENQIFVLYPDGSWERFDDTWTSDLPADDPSIVPPDGLYQPIRGFGKLWRQNTTVRARMGWAVAPEQGYESAWQPQIRESIPSVSYLRALDEKIIELRGWEKGNWLFARS